MFPDHEATTTMGGAKAPHLTDFAPVAGRPVIVWPDHDEPGQEYARTVSELALAAGARDAITRRAAAPRIPSRLNRRQGLSRPRRFSRTGSVPFIPGLAGWMAGSISILAMKCGAGGKPTPPGGACSTTRRCASAA